MNRKILPWFIQNKKKSISGLIILILLIWFWNCLPDPLFADPVSVVIEDRNGELLGAKIAKDEQWRFPHNINIPHKFKKAIIEFEDNRFYYHPGVDPAAISRAIVQNVKSGKIKSGASTISMQVVRLIRKGQSRTLWEKMIEAVWALRLELSYSKEEVLALYASNAPFGGNVVGLDAASWRYFGREPEKLSWAETALLAVLPNNPALVHPGRNREHLKAKRNFLLKKLFESGEIDTDSYKLALLEPLPVKPKRLPKYSPHLLERISEGQKSSARIKTTIDVNLQQQANRVLENHYQKLSGNGIYNIAALIADNKTGEVLVYIGNTGKTVNGKNGSSVDIITSERSTGSILKPFLYSALFHDGMILPSTLVEDFPTKFGGFQPVNFNKSYDGAVKADAALYRSLNIPAVRLLMEYGTAKFHHLLKKMGMTTLYNSSSHYGLSLILGGAEAKLWDITGMYSGMARTLNNFNEKFVYTNKDYSKLKYLKKNKIEVDTLTFQEADVLSAASIWQTFEALTEARRPETEGLWTNFNSSQKIAWKTGTSFGFRDAWAVGSTPGYTIGVWTGNADGTGRPLLTGLTAAAPVLFDLLDILPAEKKWFTQPVSEMTLIDVCEKSGHRATEFCEKTNAEYVVNAGLNAPSCPYHKKVFLDSKRKFRVTSDCVSQSEMVSENMFILPPRMEWFYKKRNSNYKTLPTMAPGCTGNDTEKSMELIYPAPNTRIYIPVELDGSQGKAVFEVAHRNPKTTIYWHIDDIYMGKTKHFHQLEVSPSVGSHKLVVIDANGKRIETKFRVYNQD